jgi:hypothetical protein
MVIRTATPPPTTVRSVDTLQIYATARGLHAQTAVAARRRASSCVGDLEPNELFEVITHSETTGCPRRDARIGRAEHRVGELRARIDPHLHTHVIVPNRQARADGHLVAIDGTSVYHEAKAAGVIYQATLRRELHRLLGFEWLLVDRSLGRRGRIDEVEARGPAFRARKDALRNRALVSLSHSPSPGAGQPVGGDV